MVRDPQATLKRLVGTGRPEISCEQCFEQLDRYVEAEIAGADADQVVPGLGAHLEGCPACDEDHASLLELIRLEREPTE